MTSRRQIDRLEALARRMRALILESTTEAGSGHPSSSLSATDLICGLAFGGAFRFDVAHPEAPNNDRLIFSKGHASPLFYALWAAAGVLTREDLLTYRQFGSVLEGHPTVRFPYTEAATGSLGQGLSIGVGEALSAKYLDRLSHRTWVLLGDSEMAEGSQWEAMQLAAHLRLDNLIGLLDVNRLGQRGETMYGHDLEAYRQRVDAFGWEPIVIDGHAWEEILEACARARRDSDRPVMVIARTIKGKGVAEIEDENGWHGKVLDRDQLARALGALGPIDASATGRITPPAVAAPAATAATVPAPPIDYPRDTPVATRTAFGRAIARLAEALPDLVCLDGEVSNSTRTEEFSSAQPDRFFEMYIAEQNMAGVALGLARRGKTPVVATFGAFLTRAFDQIRMGQYSGAAIKYVGSHAGVAIGEDGPSQMALEDLAMFRTIQNAVVLHPCDAVSTERLVDAMVAHPTTVYLRTLRQKTPVLYGSEDQFRIGGSRCLRHGPDDRVTIVAAGACVHEALAAAETLAGDGIGVRVIDMYSIKPLDEAALREAARDTGVIVTVEDHYQEGGLGEAVATALATVPVPVHILAVRRTPRSGRPEQLLDYEGISRAAIARAVRDLAA